MRADAVGAIKEFMSADAVLVAGDEKAAVEAANAGRAAAGLRPVAAHRLYAEASRPRWWPGGVAFASAQLEKKGGLRAVHAALVALQESLERGPVARAGSVHQLLIGLLGNLGHEAKCKDRHTAGDKRGARRLQFPSDLRGLQRPIPKRDVKIYPKGSFKPF